MVGKTVVVEGRIPEAGKGETHNVIQYQSMTEEKSQ
jgi:hypothetical protein